MPAYVSAENKNGKLSYPLLLLTVSLGSTFAPLNSTMLAVALPELRSEFDVGYAEVGWLVSSYLIAMAVAQPLGGRLGDQLGRSQVFRVGLLAFLALSIAAAFAPTFPLLVLFRTGQALVGAAVVPNGMAMVRESAPQGRLGQSSGFTGSAMSIAAAAGPLLGAAILEVGTWRWIFLMNVPLVTSALVALAFLGYRDSPGKGGLSLDWTGAALFAGLLVAVTFALNQLGDDLTGIALVLAVAAVIAFGVFFIRRQQSSPMPVAEWSLFRSRSYAGSTAYILLNNLVMYTTLLTIPFFVEEVQGHDSSTTGPLLGAMSILMAVLAPVAGRLSDGLGRRPPALAGSLVVAAAMVALLAGISVDSNVLFLGFCLALLGLGMGISFGPASTAAIESAPREMAGAAAGTNSMMRYVGSIIGAGVLGAVLAEDGAAPEVGLFRIIFAILVVMALAACVSSLFIHRFVATEPGPVIEAESAIGASPAR